MELDDTVSYKRNMKLLLEEVEHQRPRDESIRFLMKLTFPQRRQQIETSEASTTKLMAEFPFFAKQKWVS